MARFHYDWVDQTKENLTPEQAPYSYDAFFLWRSVDMSDSSAYYSDRMRQWNPDRYIKSFELFPGIHIEDFDRSKASKFASFYLEREVEVTGLAQGCDPRDGYPYYIFWVKN